MKAIFWILLLISFSCHDQPDFKVNQLIGTWKFKSGQIPNRWTFVPNYLYSASDTLASCKPVDENPYQYWIEKDILTLRYAGLTNGLISVSDVHYSIISLTNKNLSIVDSSNQRQDLERCE